MSSADSKSLKSPIVVSVISVICLFVLSLSCAIVPLPPLDVAAQQGEIRVMTWNIKIDRVDQTPDTWPDRHVQLNDAVRAINPDIVGLQEASSVAGFEMIPPYRPYGWLIQDLTDYGVIAPQGPGYTSVENPILYKTSRFMPIEQGVFWLSDTPYVPDSNGWGNAIARCVTWARFFDREGSRVFTVYNTHLDVDSEPSRVKSVQYLSTVLRPSEDPVLLGDFNMSRYDTAFDPIRNDMFFNDLDNDPSFDGTLSRIDHILSCEYWNVLDTWVNLPNPNPSDHKPVISRIVLK